MEVGQYISFRGIRGLVKYVGPYEGKPGTYVGLELEKPKGKNSGVIKGKKLFDCKPNHGIFAKMEDVLANSTIEPDHSPMIAKSSSSTNLQLTPKISSKQSILSPLTPEHQTQDNTVSPITPKTPQTPKEATNQNSNFSTPTQNQSQNNNVEIKNNAQNAVGKDPLPLVSPSTPMKGTKHMQISQSFQSLSNNPILERLKKYQDYVEQYRHKIEQYTNKTESIEQLIEQKDKERKIEMEHLKQEAAKTILKRQIQLEEELLKKEEEALEEARKVRNLAEAADAKVSQRKIQLLQQVNEQHVLYQNSIDQLLNTQKMNLNVVINSIHTLNRRITRTVNHAKAREQVNQKLRNDKIKKEESLIEKRPEWRDLSKLKEQVAEHQKKVQEQKLQEKIHQIDVEMNYRIIDEYTKSQNTPQSPQKGQPQNNSISQYEYPLLVLSLQTIDLMAKLETFSSTLPNGKKKVFVDYILYQLDLIIFVLSGYFNFSGDKNNLQLLMNEIQSISRQTEQFYDESSGNISNLSVKTDLIKFNNLIQQVSTIPIDKTITKHFISYTISNLIMLQQNTQNQTQVSELKKQLEELLNKLTHPIHPTLLSFQSDQETNEYDAVLKQIKLIPKKLVFNTKQKVLEYESKCKDVSIDVSSFFMLKENEDLKQKEREMQLRQQEKERLIDQVKKAEQERDTLCKKRNELLQLLKQKEAQQNQK